jgi:diguanylate cyclase (GGDEF)-like protein/PAS domain S-box-containing protein
MSKLHHDRVAHQERDDIAEHDVIECIVSLSSDFYWQTDTEFRVSRIAAGDPQERRRAADLLLGKKRWETDTVPVSGSWEEHRAALFAHKPFKNFLLEHVETDGSKRYLSISGRPRFDQRGKFLGYLGISRDVTKEVQVQTLADLELALMQVLLDSKDAPRFRRSLKLICESLGWNYGRHWHLDEAAGVLRLKDSTLENDVTLIGEADVSQVPSVQLGEGIVGRAWKTGERVSANYPSRNGAAGTDIASASAVMAVPLRGRNGFLGALEFGAKRFDYAKDRLAIFLAHVATQVGVAWDRDLAFETLRESEERFSSTVELAAIGICHVGHEGRIIHANQRLLEMLGYSKAELLSKTVREISHPDDRNLTDAFIGKLENKTIESFAVEKRYVRNDGEVVWVHIRTVMKWDKEGRALYHISIVENISERKAAEAKIEHMATHDDLTGLPNRALFNELLNQSIRSHQRLRGSRCAVLFVDLDRFKIINDSLGHHEGDTLLMTMAARIQDTVRKSDSIARIGGDEFVVLLNDVKDAANAETIARNLLAAVLAPIHLGNQECRVTASIGIAMFPDDGDDSSTLLRNADVAMYSAKQSGKNSAQRFSPDMAPMSVTRIRLETHLQYALERNELRIQYQPKVDGQTGRIMGVEALLRWWNAELGTVPPVQFIPIAEETGFIVPIGLWVIESACAQNVAWQKRGLPPISVAVNLSPRQFSDPALLDNIREILKTTRMAPEYLELEITESLLVSNLEKAIETAAQIRELGVRLAIDDFGTGYSSLMQLKRFPFDTLKIDRSFIRDIERCKEDRAITEAIIAMGKTLGVSVVAEGIEHAEQKALLRQLDCEQMQGYFFGKPCHPDEVARLCNQQEFGHANQ